MIQFHRAYICLLAQEVLSNGDLYGVVRLDGIYTSSVHDRRLICAMICMQRMKFEKIHIISMYISTRDIHYIITNVLEK